MLVSILNTTDRTGGAGIAAYRLGRALETQNVLAPLFCYHRRFNDLVTFRYRTRESEFSKSLLVYREALNRIDSQYTAQNRTTLSKTVFSSPWAEGVLIADNPLIAHSKILHLHWINRFLNLHSLHELSELNIPIVWTLHDEWLYTAGCHYTAGCDSFFTQCDNCPQLLVDPYHLVETWFEQKSQIIQKLNLTIVTPSSWLGKRAKESTLLKDKNVHVIRNPFDVTTFKPLPASRVSEIRKNHGFGDDTIVIGFGAQTLYDRRKGFELLINALSVIAERVGSADISRVGLLLFGTHSSALDNLTSKIKISYVGEMTNDKQISEVLGSLDCFIVPSLEENYPNVIMEALLCGTPVIAYECGGIPEQIDDGINGILIKPVGSIKALAEGIEKFITDNDFRAHLKSFDRNVIADRHSYETIGAETVNLYKNLNSSFHDLDRNNILSYLDFKSAKKAAARDFNGLPAYHHFCENLDILKLVRNNVEAISKELVDAQHADEDRKYTNFFNTRHIFGPESRSNYFLNFGWDAPSSQGIWSIDRRAGMAFHLPPNTATLKLQLVAYCDSTPQFVVFSIGNKQLGYIRLQPQQKQQYEIELSLPEFASSGGLTQLFLEFPQAQAGPGSPKIRGILLSELHAISQP